MGATDADRRSLGLVETQRVVLFHADDPLVLDSGETLAPVEVAYETYGGRAPGEIGRAHV